MLIKAFYYFLLIMLSGNFSIAENSYCQAMCTYSCSNFYKKEGETAANDPAAINLCVRSCMEKKCLDD